MSNPRFQNSLSIVFFCGLVLSWIYIFYLSSTTQMSLVYDAGIYQQLGRLLFEKGWGAYFTSGPNREPLYPFLVFCSLSLAKPLNLSPISMLVILQVGVIALAQFLLFKILRLLNIAKPSAFLTVLYFGISPAILNSALSGFSEIITYPFVLSLTLSILGTAKALRLGDQRAVFWSGATQGIFYFLICMIKAPYEFIVLILMVLLVFIGILLLGKQQKVLAKNFLIMIVGMCLFFFLPINVYKLLNKNGNGEFAVTSRGHQVLYHASSLRSQKLSKDLWVSGFLSIPGQDFCTQILGYPRCEFWTTIHLESFSTTPEIQHALCSVAPHAINDFWTDKAKENILKHPVQFLFLTGLDVFKLFFWETTHVGFVVYPSGVQKILDFFFVQELFRFGMFALTFGSFLYNIFFVYKRLRQSSFEAFLDEKFFTIFMIVSLVILHVGFYAFCAACVPRHALAIAPLFLILIAVFLERVIQQKIPNR